MSTAPDESKKRRPGFTWWLASPLLLWAVAAVITVTHSVSRLDLSYLDIFFKVVAGALGLGHVAAIFKGRLIWAALYLPLLLSIVSLSPGWVVATAQHQLTLCNSNLKASGNAADAYAMAHQGIYPRTLSELELSSGGEVLRCPADNSPYGYESARNPDAYTLWCRGAVHQKIMSRPQGYPQYSSSVGLQEEWLPGR